jgi:hypothetical protein
MRGRGVLLNGDRFWEMSMMALILNMVWLVGCVWGFGKLFAAAKNSGQFAKSEA